MNKLIITAFTALLFVSFSNRFVPIEKDTDPAPVQHDFITKGNFNSSEPAFVSYTRIGNVISETQIVNVVASSDQTGRTGSCASYASYAVDQSASTKWQSIPMENASGSVSITFDFGADYSISKVKLTADSFPDSLQVSVMKDGAENYTTVSAAFNADNGIIDLGGEMARRVKLTATGLRQLYGTGAYGFELKQAAFFTDLSLSVKEALPIGALKVTNPYNMDTYKVSDGGDITLKLYGSKAVHKIAIKSKEDLSLSKVDIYYMREGKETLLRKVSALTGTDGTQFFEFDPVFTDIIIIKSLNACELYHILLYEWDTNSTSWAATDGLGRRIATYDDIAYAKRQNKQVGIFYFLWHFSRKTGGNHYDVTKILQQNPNAMEDGLGMGAMMELHFWGEPAFGFYNQNDEWVLRKDAKMLSDAGVDFLIFDCSNTQTGNLNTLGFKREILKLCEVFTAIRTEGGKTPQFMFFMAPTSPANGIANFDFWWENLYKNRDYEDLWYKWDNGKPMVLGIKDWNAGKPYYDFFEYRTTQSMITPFYTQQENDWAWVASYPQGKGFSADYPVEMINASPAQNVPFTNNPADYADDPNLSAYKTTGFHTGLSDGYDTATGTTKTRGRDFSGGTVHSGIFSGGSPAAAADVEKAVYEGWNFRDQLAHTLDMDPRVTFITGWNEWIMYRIPGSPGLHGIQAPNHFFWDQFNYRYTRDIQPLSYLYKDATYYQMVDFIRKYKGANPVKTAPGPVTISMDGFADWLKVENVYYSDIGDVTHRDAYAFNNQLRYTDTTGRNDIMMSKVSYDADNVYFYVKTKDAITPYTDPSWMRLFIRTGGNGWEGYDYIVNRNAPTAEKATLEHFNAHSWSCVPVGEIDYKLNGREMQIKIPRSMLQLTGDVNFEFKWHDNMQKQGEALEFTVSGDAAPSGRFNYVFRGLSQEEDAIREPYSKVSGSFSGIEVPLSPDPLVAYRWESPKSTDSLERTFGCRL